MENKPICQHCGKEIERGIGKNGLKEENYRYLSRKFCNSTCYGDFMNFRDLSPKNLEAIVRLSRRTYAKRAKAYRKSHCERCGTDKMLTVHHINKEWWNNDPSNLMTVCHPCHSKIHHEQGDIKVPIGDRLPCRVCGAEYKPGSSRGDLCNTHRLRLKRYNRENAIRKPKGYATAHNLTGE